MGCITVSYFRRYPLIPHHESQQLLTSWNRSTTDKPKSMVRGQRLYATGQGAAQVKDDMPVQIRLARRTEEFAVIEV